MLSQDVSIVPGTLLNTGWKTYYSDVRYLGFSHRKEHPLIIGRPVGLKEAALDSPTFRSGFTHFSEQVDYLEKWLENYVRSITRLSQEIGTFESLVNGFLTTVSSPPHVSEAAIDHDYTLVAMERYAEGARDFWDTIFAGLKQMDINMVEPIRAFLLNDLRSFKVGAYPL